MDTLVLATPQGDVTQSIGRIQREYPGKKRPLVLDLFDAHIGGVIHGMGRKRFKFYKVSGFPQYETKIFHEKNDMLHRFRLKQ